MLAITHLYILISDEVMMMKKFKPAYVTSGFFLLMIVLLMFSAVCVYAAKKTNDIISSSEEETNTNEIKIDWEALYPFEIGTQKEIERRDTIFERIYYHVKNKCEEYSTKRLIGYNSIVDCAKMYEELVRWNMTSYYEYNGVIKLRDGYLTGFDRSVDITENAQSTIELAEFCRERGIEFFYANLPVKTCIYEDKNISGVLDFANQNADRFLAMLYDAGVKYYDFRKILHEDGMNHHEAFYITDHHWKAETGLWAARHILKFLRDDYGWDVNPDMLNPDRFDYVIYPEWFLGSQGKKITLERTKPDDFTMIYPKFNTSIHYEIPGKEINTNGDFTTTYNMEAVESRDYYNKNPYGAYNYGDKSLIKIENLMNTNGKKILIIHDSFSNSLVPFAAMGVQYTYSIDVRHFTGSLRSYISKHKPDVIAVIYHSGVTSVPMNLESHNSMYDFR